MTDRLRCFVPHEGKLKEMDPSFALRLKNSPRTAWRPDPIAIKTDGHNAAVRMWAVLERDKPPVILSPFRDAFGNEVASEPQKEPPAIYRPTILMVTTQARKMAEASIWVAAVHAFVALAIYAQIVAEHQAASN